MKKILFALVAAAALLVGCQPKPVLVSKITLSQTTGSVVEGETLHLSAIVTPKEATNPELTWSTSNPTVATVTGNGDVSALTPGDVKITAAATDGSGVTATCELTVTKKAIPVTAVGLNETAITLKKDETFQLVGAVTPNDATDQTLTWASDKTDVATVDATGKVTAKATGTAKITATTNDGTNLSATCTVTVIEPKPLFVQYPYLLLRTAESFTQGIWYGTVDNYRNREDAEGLTWTSDNAAVATVEEHGIVSAVAPGKATVTVKDALGSTVTFEVNVEDKPARTYDEYLPGISIWDCRDASLAWNKSTTQYALTDGYVPGTQCMGATINAYKVAELYFTKKTDVSSIKNPAIFLRFYIEDVSKLTTDEDGEDQPYIEIRSTGQVWVPGTTSFPYSEEPKTFWRMKEIFTNWDNHTASAKQTLVNGWNNVLLPVSEAARQDCDLSAITYFRIYQLNGKTYQPNEWRFDQIRVVDWTEFELCDNFAMWRDRPAQAGRYCYAYETTGQAEGAGCLATRDLMMVGHNSAYSYRLEMWPGLDYAMPAMFDQNDLKLQLKFFVDDDDLDFFNQYIHFRLELGKKGFDPAKQSWVFTPDQNCINMSIGATTAFPLNLQKGWNTVTFNFSDFKDVINGDFDIRKLGYLRVILTLLDPDNNAPVGYRTYKVDDIRILKK